MSYICHELHDEGAKRSIPLSNSTRVEILSQYSLERTPKVEIMHKVTNSMIFRPALTQTICKPNLFRTKEHRTPRAISLSLHYYRSCLD